MYYGCSAFIMLDEIEGRGYGGQRLLGKQEGLDAAGSPLVCPERNPELLIIIDACTMRDTVHVQRNSGQDVG